MGGVGVVYRYDKKLIEGKEIVQYELFLHFSRCFHKPFWFVLRIVRMKKPVLGAKDENEVLLDFAIVLLYKTVNFRLVLSLPLSLLMTAQEAFVDSVDQD